MSVYANRQTQIVRVTAPTLVAGAFNVTFPNLSKIIRAGVIHYLTIETADYVYFLYTSAIAGNVVTITGRKILTSGAGPNAWADMETADLAAMNIDVLAEGI